MNRETWVSLIVVATIIGLILLFTSTLVYYVSKREGKFNAACAAKGGVYKSTRYKRICFKKDSVIEVEE